MIIEEAETARWNVKELKRRDGGRNRNFWKGWSVNKCENWRDYTHLGRLSERLTRLTRPV